MPILLGGPPGSGKTTLARLLRSRVRAVPLCLATIERALGAGAGDAAYRVGWALAEDLLRLGEVVIADAASPTAALRDGWSAVARQVAVPLVAVEIVRTGAALPAGYAPWDTPHVVVDTAGRAPEQSVTEVLGALQIY